MDISTLIDTIKKKEVTGALDIIKNLDPDCDINENHKETTALIEAIILGKVELVEALVHAGSDVNRGCEHAVSPLCVAAAVDNLCMAQLLLKLGADLTKLVDTRPLCQIATPLHYAIENRNVMMTDLLLSHGHDPNCPSHIYRYPLLEAIRNNSPGIVRLLVARPSCMVNSRINNTGGWSFPPLYQAIFRFRRNQIVQILLDTERCQLRFQSDSYICVLLWRMRDTAYDHVRVAGMLLEAGADMDYKDRLGNTPIKSYISGNKVVVLGSAARVLRKVVLGGITPTLEEVELVKAHIETDTDRDFYQWVHELATTPRTLQDITTRYLRHYFGVYPNGKLDQLPLPHCLLDMLTLRHLRSL